MSWMPLRRARPRPRGPRWALARRAGRLAATLSLAVIAASPMAACGSGSGPPPTPAAALRAVADRQPSAILASPFASVNQTSVPFGARSHWMQPWRGYLDTPPATALLDAVGINIDNHVTAAEAPALAQLLHQSGFRRARYEIGWGDVSYTKPGQLINDGDVRRVVMALRDNGIRPLILLNANAGQPCPVKPFMAQITQPAHQGDRQLTVDSKTAAQVVPGRTGLNDLSGQYQAADVLFAAIRGNVVTLSKPLPRDLNPGSFAAVTLKYVPFGPPRLSNGSPNPEFEQTMRGWLSYVRTVTREVRSVLGSDNFDVEVWNELSFGSDFLNQAAYYQPPKTPGSGDVTTEILKRTLADVRGSAPQVGVGDGFESQRPGPGGTGVPAGLTAVDRHPYSSARAFPDAAANDNPGVRAVDANGRPDGTHVQTPGGPKWQDSFIPRYTALFPEYFLTAIQTETAIADLSPLTTMEYGLPHGRATHPPGAPPPGVWVTEWNTEPGGGDLSNPSSAGRPSAGFSAADVHYLQAKAMLRFLVSWVNKGVSAVDFYAAKDGNLALVDPGFFSAVDAHGGAYPGTTGGGVAMDALRRLTASFAGAGPLATPAPLSLRSIGDFGAHAQFKGDGTSAHPPLYDRNVIGFFPFQVTDRSWSVPVYVMTRNIAQVYRAGSPSNDPRRFDLPDEVFELTIGGLPAGAPLTATATDPLTGQSIPVRIRQRRGDQVVLDTPLTDSPRTLTLTAR